MTPPAWLADPGLAQLWTALRARLERNGLVMTGRLTVDGLTRPERRAVGGLLGRTLTADRVTVDIAALDLDLARRSGIGGLATVLEAVTGEPLVSRPAARTQLSAVREAPFAAAREWLRAHPQPVPVWVEQWLAGLRRAGTLTGLPDAAKVLSDALAVLTSICSEHEPKSRASLAAGLLGDAHALDDDRIVAHLVLRGLATAVDEAMPQGTRARRELWERFGVLADSVSSTCLTLGLRAGGDGTLATRMASAADAGDPVHLTPWDLRRVDVFTAPRPVLVCENPSVLEAVAQRHGSDVPMVCTAGQPALVVLDVLSRVTAPLNYHGDFDWPGIAIANRLVTQAGTRPWMMAAHEYRAAADSIAGGVPLVGTSVIASWDITLTDAMRSYGIAVHEEAVLEPLLAAVTDMR
jgi:uncharacterized protein (TIGR02679 family)